LAELAVVLQELRAVVAAGAAAYEAHKDDDTVLSLGFTSRLDSVKVTSSVLVGDIVQRAMAICGLAAYRNDSPESLGRHLRDAAGAPLMVSNDRALEAAAQTLLVRKEL
jgi:acyl-CoA dehydrogenase